MVLFTVEVANANASDAQPMSGLTVKCRVGEDAEQAGSRPSQLIPEQAPWPGLDEAVPPSTTARATYACPMLPQENYLQVEVNFSNVHNRREAMTFSGSVSRDGASTELATPRP
ncbi:hypothetical protein GCM10009799_52240 [Nocardiopsis rhodophaea]|uniref:Uncharacterized protein n=1 Tax=Nocardiopsis rhodophaea TaxID=280238 RepID=A0ABN2TSH3_9ACTN